MGAIEKAYDAAQEWWDEHVMTKDEAAVALKKAIQDNNGDATMIGLFICKVAEEHLDSKPWVEEQQHERWTSSHE
jgi:hypothetical protein